MQYLREQQYENLFEEKVQEDGARKQKTALALRVALHWNPNKQHKWLGMVAAGPSADHYTLQSRNF